MEDENRIGIWSVVIGIVVAMIVLMVVGGVIIFSVLSGTLSGDISTVSDVNIQSVGEATPTPVLSHTVPPVAEDYAWELVSEDFDNPLYMAAPNDDSGRLFVVQQTGIIWIVEGNSVLPEPFLNIEDNMPTEVFRGGYTERGLLGLAFDPHFKRTGTFYVSYVNNQSMSIVERFQVSPSDPNQADMGSRQVVLEQLQPAPDHNGGAIQFGPDGYLYVAFGDGGSLEDPNRTGQDPGTWLGKLLRIDVSTQPYTVPADNPRVNDRSYLPEIYLSGLRNPWRLSFDRVTGDLYIGDVGQAEREEINFIPAGVSGLNLGWSAFEGTLPLYEQPILGEVTPPIAEYAHDQGCSVTGGYVYRGSDLPALQGYYIAGDYCTGRIWYAYREPAGAWKFGLWMQTEHIISSFAEDADGELYLLDYKGAIYRLVAAPQ